MMNRAWEVDSPDSQPSYRIRPLPRGELQGQFFIPTSVLVATRDSLLRFEQWGREEGGHEGIVYWAGREAPDCTIFLQAVLPVAEHGPGYVSVTRPEIGRTRRAARASHLGVLAQVHSHPGWDARHSDGDDEMILLPFEGMLSVVAPEYGREMRTAQDLCIHQFQAGTWVLCSTTSVKSQFIEVPSLYDLT